MNAIIKQDESGFVVFPAGTRAEDVPAMLTPATAKTKAKATAMLFTALKARSGSDADAAMTAEIYDLAISEFPDWAIEEAVKGFITGRVENASPVFVPTTAELANECRRQMWLRIRIDRPEQPKTDETVFTPEHRKRMRDRFAALKEDLAKTTTDGESS